MTYEQICSGLISIFIGGAIGIFVATYLTDKKYTRFFFGITYQFTALFGFWVIAALHHFAIFGGQ